jgi:hypothetical protein
MKKLLVLLVPIFILTGCDSDGVPVSVLFPEVPRELVLACPDLAQVDPSTEKISELLTVVTKNYGEYYECKAKVDNWIEWYATQKKIFDKVSK